jgi:threonine aldolase
MIDLFSDTMTRPTPAMRKAMAEAPVGDEQRREDPTTNKLQERVAEMLGKEAAVFLPSGTMCNEVAIKTHCVPGEAVICDKLAHIMRSEFGSAAALSGVTTDHIEGASGIFSPHQLEAALANYSPYSPVPRLLCVEQTHNFGGGAVWPLGQLREVCKIAHDRKMLTHMDGARLFNAQVATGISAKEYAASFDSVWIDLSKGLGCPVGAVLAGTKDFIDRSWRFKHMFGGAMRQSGILAAAGLDALDHHIDRLADDHANAKLLAQGLATIKGVRLDTLPPQTNIVFFHIDRADMTTRDFLTRLEQRNVRMSAIGQRVRAVTNLDVTREQIEQAVDAVRAVLA